MHPSRPIRLTSLVVAFLTLTSMPQVARSTEPYAKVGVYAAQFLILPTGTRNVAMGRAGVADDLDPINVVYNPANLALLRGLAFSGSYVDWLANVDIYDFGVFGGTELPLRSGYTIHLAAAVRHFRLDLDSRLDRTIFLPDETGMEFDARDTSVPISFSGGVSKGEFEAAVGATVEFATTTLEDQSTRFAAFDIGLLVGTHLYSTEPVTFRIAGGVSASNLGADVDFGTRSSKLPKEYRGGIGIQFGYFDSDFAASLPLVTINANADYLDTTKDGGLLFGGEIGLVDTAFFRLGHRDDEFADSGTSYGLGLQLKIKKLKIRGDYARLPAPRIFGGKADAFGITGLINI